MALQLGPGRNYSTLMPANLITFVHFSLSSAINLPKAAGEPSGPAAKIQAYFQTSPLPPHRRLADLVGPLRLHRFAQFGAGGGHFGKFVPPVPRPTRVDDRARVLPRRRAQHGIKRRRPGALDIFN